METLVVEQAGNLLFINWPGKTFLENSAKVLDEFVQFGDDHFCSPKIGHEIIMF